MSTLTSTPITLPLPPIPSLSSLPPELQRAINNRLSTDHSNSSDQASNVIQIMQACWIWEEKRSRSRVKSVDCFGGKDGLAWGVHYGVWSRTASVPISVQSSSASTSSAITHPFLTLPQNLWRSNDTDSKLAIEQHLSPFLSSRAVVAGIDEIWLQTQRVVRMFVSVEESNTGAGGGVGEDKGGDISKEREEQDIGGGKRDGYDTVDRGNDQEGVVAVQIGGDRGEMVQAQESDPQETTGHRTEAVTVQDIAPQGMAEQDTCGEVLARQDKGGDIQKGSDEQGNDPHSGQPMGTETHLELRVHEEKDEGNDMGGLGGDDFVDMGDYGEDGIGGQDEVGDGVEDQVGDGVEDTSKTNVISGVAVIVTETATIPIVQPPQIEPPHIIQPPASILDTTAPPHDTSGGEVDVPTETARQPKPPHDTPGGKHNTPTETAPAPKPSRNTPDRGRDTPTEIAPRLIPSQDTPGDGRKTPTETAPKLKPPTVAPTPASPDPPPPPKKKPRPRVTSRDLSETPSAAADDASADGKAGSTSSKPKAKRGPYDVKDRVDKSSRITRDLTGTEMCSRCIAGGKEKCVGQFWVYRKQDRITCQPCEAASKGCDLKDKVSVEFAEKAFLEGGFHQAS